MQKEHSYPSRIYQPPTRWYARAGATVDADPLPKLPHTRHRTLRIREIFLHDLGGRATLDQVGTQADEEGLLDGLSFPASARETVLAALRPIATSDYYQSAAHWATVEARSAPGQPRVRLR